MCSLETILWLKFISQEAYTWEIAKIFNNQMKIFVNEIIKIMENANDKKLDINITLPMQIIIFNFS